MDQFSICACTVDDPIDTVTTHELNSRCVCLLVGLKIQTELHLRSILIGLQITFGLGKTE